MKQPQLNTVYDIVYKFHRKVFLDGDTPNMDYVNEAIKALEDLIEKRVKEVSTVCACMMTTPCNAHCTCANPYQSHGCSRCATYGNEEQRMHAAKKIAKLIPAEEKYKPDDRYDRFKDNSNKGDKS